MPFYERKSYDEMIAPQATAPAPIPQIDVPFSELAHSVLASETAPRAPVSGPYRCQQACQPGGKGVITMELSVDRTGGSLKLKFQAENLHGPEGAFIDSSLIEITPRTLDIDPGGRADLRIEVRIPQMLPAGLYSGRIVGEGDEPLTFRIEFEIYPDARAGTPGGSS